MRFRKMFEQALEMKRREASSFGADITGYSDRWFKQVLSSLGDQDRLHVGFAGGESPDRFIRFLKKQQNISSKFNFFIIDERAVPFESKESNTGQFIRKMNTPSISLESAMSLYEAGARLEALDLVILGIGEDGHVASLFPTLSDDDYKHSGDVVKTPKVGVPEVERYSLSMESLLSARKIILSVRGGKKLQLLKEFIDTSDEKIPVVKLMMNHQSISICKV